MGGRRRALIARLNYWAKTLDGKYLI